MGNVLKRYHGTSWEAVGGTITGDTLPIGSEVDYTGTDIPAGWEEVESYSTSEVNTGQTWIDGKPIYKKVINTGNMTSAVSHGISNLDWVISIYGVAKTNDNNYLPINFANPNGLNYQLSAYIQGGGNVGLNKGSGFTISSSYLIVEYTKTTD